MTPRSALALLACLVFTACPAGEEGDGSDTGGSSTGGGETGDSSTGAGETGATEATSGGDEACACIDPVRSDFDSYICASPPCGTVALACDDAKEGKDALCDLEAELVSFDEAALDCSLDRLIARSPGIVEFHATFTASGSVYEGGFVDASTGLMRTYSGAEAGRSESAAGFVTLKDAAYFEGCKAEADVAARFACFKAWAVEAEPTAQCDDPMESHAG